MMTASPKSATIVPAMLLLIVLAFTHSVKPVSGFAFSHRSQDVTNAASRYHCNAFHSQHRQHSHAAYQTTIPSRTSLHSVKSSSTDTKKNDQKATSTKEEAVLSDVDARVLQAMLAEDKLNVKEESNLKDLLDRGIRSKEKVSTDADAQQETGTEETKSKFSSTIFKTMTDTKLWKLMQRNAQDIVDSAKIFVANRVERDSKLLGALGVFAFDRVVQDVKRALPAAVKATKKAIQLQLGNSSSYSTMSNTTGAMVFLESLVEDDDNATDILQDMTTTADEIKAVSESVREIFRSGGSSTFASSTDRRNLRSTVERSRTSSTERFSKAYERTKATKLKQEKENIAQKAARATGSVVDSAWELRREIKSEVNEPGYKSKRLRENASKTTQKLQEGAQRILQSVKRDKSAQLESKSSAGSKDDNTFFIETTATERADSTPQTKSANIPNDETPMQDIAVDVSSTTTDVDGENVLTIEIGDEREATDNDGDGVPKFKMDAVKKLGGIQASCQDEIEVILERLSMCIENPYETWLDQEVLDKEKEPAELDMPAIEWIVTSLVTTQNMILLDKQLIEDNMDNTQVETVEMWLDALKDTKAMVDDIVLTTEEKAGSNNIAQYFNQEFLYRNRKNEERPTILQIEQLDDKFAAYSKLMEAMSKASTFDGEDLGEKEAEMSKDIFIKEVVADLVDAIPDILDIEVEAEGVNNKQQQGRTKPITADVQFSTDQSSANTASVKADNVMTSDVVVEIITDDDFEEAVGESPKRVIKQAEKGSVDDDDESEKKEEEEEPNVIVKVSLRALDITFFVVEKTITVVIPQLFSATQTASVRIDEAKKEGMGSAGWKQITSAQRGSNRY